MHTDLSAASRHIVGSSRPFSLPNNRRLDGYGGTPSAEKSPCESLGVTDYTNQALISLRHIGILLSVSARDAAAGPGQDELQNSMGIGNGPHQERNRQLLHLKTGQQNVSYCLSYLHELAGDELAEPVASCLINDNVLQQLSKALDAAERSDDEFSALYADAARLAIVTRILSFQPHLSNARESSGLPKWRLKRVLDHVRKRLSETIRLDDMATAAGLSKMHFAAQFRVATGLRPHEFVVRHRIQEAQRMLQYTDESIVNVALNTGFQSQAHFTTVFRRVTADTPYRWRQQSRRTLQSVGVAPTLGREDLSRAI